MLCRADTDPQPVLSGAPFYFASLFWILADLRFSSSMVWPKTVASPNECWGYEVAGVGDLVAKSAVFGKRLG